MGPVSDSIWFSSTTNSFEALRQSTDLFGRIDQLIQDAKSNTHSMAARNEIVEKGRILIASCSSFEESNIHLARIGLCRLLKVDVEDIQREIVDILKYLLSDRHLAKDFQLLQQENLIELKNYLCEIIEYLINQNSSESFLSSLLERYLDIIERLRFFPALKVFNATVDASCPGGIRQFEEILPPPQLQEAQLLQQLQQWMGLAVQNEHFEMKQELQDTYDAVQKLLQPVSEEIHQRQTNRVEQIKSLGMDLARFSWAFGNVKRCIYHYLQALETLDQLEVQNEGRIQTAIRQDKLFICGMVFTQYEKLKDYKNAALFNEKTFLLSKDEQLNVEFKIKLEFLGNLCRLLGILKEHEKAKKYLLEGLEFIRSSKEDVEEEYKFLHNLGILYELQKDYANAVLYFTQSLKKTAPLNVRYLLKNHLKLIRMSYLIGDRSQAVTSSQEVLGIAPSALDQSELRQEYYIVGVIHLEFGNYQEAITVFKERLRQCGKKDAVAYWNIGVAYEGLSDYHKAKEYYELALDCTEDKSQIGNITTFLGGTCLRLGQCLQALQYQKQALLIGEELQDFSLQKDALANTAQIYMSLADDLQRMKFLLKALEIAERHDCKGKEKLYRDIGIFYYLSRDYEQAISYYAQSLQIVSANHDRLEVASLLVLTGQAQIGLTDYEKANQAIQRSLQIALEIGNIGTIGECHKQFSKLYLKQKNYQKALEHAKEGLNVLKDFEGALAEIYNLIASIYLDLEDFVAAEANLRKTVHYYSDLLDSLLDNNQSKITLFNALAAAYTKLEFILTAQNKLAEALAVSDSRRVKTLISKLANYSKTKNLDLIDIRDIARRHNTTLIIYSVSAFLEKEAKIGVWIISPNGHILWHKLKIDVIKDDLEDIIAFFKKFDLTRSFENLDSLPEVPFLKDIEKFSRSRRHEQRLKEVQERYHAKLREFKAKLTNWYQVLIQPIEQYLPAQNSSLTIIPDAFLYKFPFALLCDSKGTYLVEKYAVQFSPSVKTLDLLAKQQDFAQDALVVGNPTNPFKDDNLQFAKTEAKNVGTLLKNKGNFGEVKVALHEEPTVGFVLERMQKCRWLHFACHGDQYINSKDLLLEEKLNLYTVFNGLLWLAPDENHPNGYLHAEAIVNHNVKAEHVFLSACYSGTGKLQKEGNIGLVWSFLAAGTSSIIATYWQLPESESTVQFVETYYRGILDDKLNKAQALRHAMIEAINKDRENPYQWGSFFLTGLS